MAILVVLIALTGLVSYQRTADACASCLIPDAGSGICVACTTDGCDPNAPPVDNAKNCFDGCSANQENCGCTVGPDCGFID